MEQDLPADYEERRLPERVYRALEQTDSMPKEVKPLVHDYGHAIVMACLNAGVSNPNIIRSLVHSIWDGARQPHQKRTFDRPREAQESPVLDKLDWLLIQSGSNICARTLLRVLWQNSMTILPINPGSVMVCASMETVTGYDVRCTKEEKHRRRLKAAIDAQAKRLWPHLFEKEKAPERGRTGA